MLNENLINFLSHINFTLIFQQIYNILICDWHFSTLIRAGQSALVNQDREEREREKKEAAFKFYGMIDRATADAIFSMKFHFLLSIKCVYIHVVNNEVIAPAREVFVCTNFMQLPPSKNNITVQILTQFKTTPHKCVLLFANKISLLFCFTVI